MIDGHAASVLVMLGEQETPLSLGTIAGRLGMSKAQASRLCKTLTERKLLRREPSTTDLRMVLFRLSSAGRRELARVEAA